MGVVHKLRSEVIDFVLEQKKKNTALSCRKLTALVLDSFNVELSKSSINAIIKGAGLSAPVGRTPKKKRQRIVMPNLPVLLEDASTRHCEERSEESISENGIASPSARNDSNDATLRNDDEAEKESIRQEEVEKEALRLQEEERLELQAQEKEKVLEEERKKEELKKVQEEAEAKERQEEAARKAQEEETRSKAEDEAAKKAEEEKWLKLAQEEAEKRAQEEVEKEALRPKEEAQAPESLSIGRFTQLENTGIILLRAADSLIGVSRLIASTLKSRLLGLEGDCEAAVENIIYLPLLKGKIENNLIDKISGVLNEIENAKVLNLDIARIINIGLKEVRCVKVILSDGANLYLDGQFYSAWSSPHIPYDFASPIHNLKKRINQYFNRDEPFILFNAPGYDTPSLEFFNFLAGLEGKGRNITNLILYGNKLEELEVLPVTEAGKKRSFVFGVWPWQFTECRKVKSIGEFRRFELPEQKRSVYIADIEMELRNPGLNKQLTVYGSALKLSLQEKTRLVILSNLAPEAKSREELVSLYLGHWPNLEEAFQDYSRKIELFTYTANSQRFFNAENLELIQVAKVRDLFQNYLVALDAYVRWHLLPTGYEDEEIGVTKERFYDLSAQANQKERSLAISLVLPAEYQFGRDLSYALRRLNEKEVFLADGLKLYFESVF